MLPFWKNWSRIGIKQEVVIIQINISITINVVVILQKNRMMGDFTMWVITVFEQKDVRIFEYTNKGEATKALQNFKKNAVLTYTK